MGKSKQKLKELPAMGSIKDKNPPKKRKSKAKPKAKAKEEPSIKTPPPMWEPNKVYVSPVVEAKVERRVGRKTTAPELRCFTSVYYEPFVAEFVEYMNVGNNGDKSRVKIGKIFKSKFCVTDNKRGYIAEIEGLRKWFKDAYSVAEWLYVNAERYDHVIYPKYVRPKEKPDKDFDIY